MLLDGLVEKRLLVKDRRSIQGAETETVEVAHEALLREWPELHQVLQDEREFLQWLARISFEVEQYQHLPPASRNSVLLQGFALREAENWVRRKAEAIPEEILSFINMSEYLASSKKWRTSEMHTYALYSGDKNLRYISNVDCRPVSGRQQRLPVDFPAFFGSGPDQRA